MAPRVLPTAHTGAMHGAGRAPRPALGFPRPQRPAALGKKSLAGNSRHLDGARSALLVTRWICCEDGLKRSKGNMHIEQVSAYFCPPSRGGSPCAALPAGGQAKNIRGAGGQPGQREPRRHNVDNEDNKAPRRARRARRAREAEGARQEHDGLEKQKQHGTSTSTSTSTSTNDSRICPQRAAMRVKSCCAAAPAQQLLL